MTRFSLTGAVLGAPDARELAAFYERLLGRHRENDGQDWVKLVPPGGGASLSFQTEPGYIRPVWPHGPGDQQMMAHLDIEVDDLAGACAHAAACGAKLADFQPQEHVRVHLDPAGHPFCLWTNG
jgi:catechol 2,3-dioxygenase-like lactoylglutathione lyase family enzyme